MRRESEKTENLPRAAPGGVGSAWRRLVDTVCPVWDVLTSNIRWNCEPKTGRIHINVEKRFNIIITDSEMSDRQDALGNAACTVVCRLI